MLQIRTAEKNDYPAGISVPRHHPDVYYEDTGWTDYRIFELLLKEKERTA